MQLKPLSWPPTKKSDGTEESATTGKVDGCRVLPETQFFWSRLHVDSTRVLSVESSVFPMGRCRRETEFDIKPPFRAPLMIFPQVYVQMSFPKGNNSARQWLFGIRVLSLLCELPRAIYPHLPVYQFQHPSAIRGATFLPLPRTPKIRELLMLF